MFAELSDYLDEQLDDSMCEELEKHMDSCENCKAFLASLESAIEQCRKAPGEPPDGKRASKLRKQIIKDYKRVTRGMVSSS
jgi:anti-sigma factor RsiW